MVSFLPESEGDSGARYPLDRGVAEEGDAKRERPKSETRALPDLSKRMLVDLMLPWVSLRDLLELWMKSRPRAAPAAILSRVLQSSGVRPGPLLPVRLIQTL